MKIDIHFLDLTPHVAPGRDLVVCNRVIDFGVSVGFLRRQVQSAVDLGCPECSSRAAFATINGRGAGIMFWNYKTGPVWSDERPWVRTNGTWVSLRYRRQRIGTWLWNAMLRDTKVKTVEVDVVTGPGLAFAKEQQKRLRRRGISVLVHDIR